MLRFAPLLIALLFSSAAAADSFSSVEERMSAAEFKAAGLDKLSDAELRALNEWLRGERAPAPAASPANEDRRGLYTPSYSSGDKIISRIAGEFRGWRGSKTTFTLENGQVWQSTDPSATFSVKLDSPTVTISPGMLDAWFLKVDGYSSTVRVRRIK